MRQVLFDSASGTIMVENFKDGDFIHGTFSLEDEVWLRVDEFSHFTIYAFSYEKPFGWEPSWSSISPSCKWDKHLLLMSKPVKIVATFNTVGLWDYPDYWHHDISKVRITDVDGKVIYDGDFLCGLSGEIFRKTNGVFTSMKFIREFFYKRADAVIDELKDEWVIVVHPAFTAHRRQVNSAG